MNELYYIRQLQNNLRNYREKSPTVIQASCNICGDSKFDKWKARLYFIYDNKERVYFCKCHNCGYSASFKYYLKHNFPEVYNSMLLENFKSTKKNNVDTIENVINNTKAVNLKELQEKNKINKYAKTLMECGVTEVYEYCEERKFTERHMNEMYFVEDFNKFTNEMGIKTTVPKEPRIVIPFYENDKLIGWQGRTLGGEGSKKYLTMKYNNDSLLIYNIDNVVKTKTIFVTEGAIDSMFLDNSIATNGIAHFDNDFTRKYKNMVVFILDNEKYNKNISNQVKKLIDNGFSVYYNNGDFEGKDVNEWFNSGKYTKEEIESIIKSKTQKGMIAKLNYVKYLKS